VDLRVQPRARRTALENSHGTLKAAVTAPPEDGKANAAVIALIATHFGLRKAQVTIKSGAAGRLKRVTLGE
jgi:uncharacterized protein (TIGR00251 family)